MSAPIRSFDADRSARAIAHPYAEPVTDRWPLAARATLVMTLCGLFWGGIGAAVLHIASR